MNTRLTLAFAALAAMSLPAMPDYPHTIDRWDDATGETRSSRLPPSATTSSRSKRIARRSKRWPKDKITLRNRARIIEQS